MYKRLEISEFRGIKHAVLDNLGGINILVGRNNMGKSSCLDAAYLLTTARSKFRDALGEDALKRTTLGTTHAKTGWDYLIRTGSTKASITGQCDDDTSPDNLVIAKTHNELGEYSSELLGRVGFAVRNHLKRNLAERDLLFHLRGGTEVLGELYMAGGAGAVDSVVEETPHGSTDHAPPKGMLVADIGRMGKKMHDTLVKTGTIDGFITQIKTIVPGVTDVRIIEDMLYLCMKNGKNLPVETMGDGIKMSVFITMAVHVAGGGIVMIEEPENHMHPGLMFRVIDMVVSGCKSGTQFIISTHSYEILDYVLQATPPDLKVSVFRINKVGENTVVAYYDKAAAVECLNELDVDLRGL